MPVWPALTSLTHRRQLPPAVYVLIDAIDTTHRAHELPCNADFWLAVQQELLPLVKAIASFSDRADRTVVAGQSFGGLSALYALSLIHIYRAKMRTGAHIPVQIFNAVDHRGVTQAAKQGFKLLPVTDPRHCLLYTSRCV